MHAICINRFFTFCQSAVDGLDQCCGGYRRRGGGGVGPDRGLAAAKSRRNSRFVAGPVIRNGRHQGKALLRSVFRLVRPRIRAFCLQMKKVLQRLVDVKGGDESTGVVAGIDYEIGKRFP